MKFKFFVIFIISTVFCQKTVADIYFQNNIVYVKNIIIDDHIRFKKIITEEKIDKVIFENCYGGTPFAGYQIAKEIENQQLDTYFKGRVVSSCAIAFMGGKNRYSEKSAFFYKNTLIFHAIRGRKDFTEEESKIINEKIDIKNKSIPVISNEGILKSTNFSIDYINKRTNNNMPEFLKENIRNAIKNTDGLVIESRFTLFGESNNIHYCIDSQTTANYSYCPEIKNISFEKLNIIHKSKP